MMSSILCFPTRQLLWVGFFFLFKIFSWASFFFVSPLCCGLRELLVDGCLVAVV
jgi:hypothetical protein